MKKHLCLLLAAILCLLSLPASALYVPPSTSKLPDMLSMPETPQIVRVQKQGSALTITVDRALPSDALVMFLAVDADCRNVHLMANDNGDRTYSADGLPSGGQWLGMDIAWTDGYVNAVAHYNEFGGLARVTRYDNELNAYIYDEDGKFFMFGNAQTGVCAKFDTRGVLTSYGYEAAQHLTVWFNLQGDIIGADYSSGVISASWEPGLNWFVSTPKGRMKVDLDISPWGASPLLPVDEEDIEAQKPEKVYYPNNTICIAGLTLQEADKSLPDKWYNVLPVDLTKEGRSTYYLMISNVRLIGKCYVDVWGDEVTVSCKLIENTAIEPKSSFGRWFTNLSDITAASIESDANGIVFGEPVSISQDLGGADTALLFIRSKATYAIPFKDGTELTRYWRNKDEWKEFRQGLQELLPRMEK